MALEDLTGTKYIDALVATNPVPTDDRPDGVGHFQGIKNVLKTTFANITGAVTATHTDLNKTSQFPTISSAEAYKGLRVNTGGTGYELVASVPNPSLIINGGMQVWQRNTSFTGPTSAYTADRWKYASSNAATVTVSKATSTPYGVGSSLGLYVNTADASVAAGDYSSLQQFIEGYDAAILKYGTAYAETSTLSFWVQATKTGTHCISLSNSAGNRCYVAEYTVNATGTWEYKTITIPGDTTGTWLADSGRGIAVRFALMAGSTYQGATGWSANDYLATTNQVNALDTAANYFNIKDVKLELGSVATPMCPRSLKEELDLCQRYYERNPSGSGGTYPVANSLACRVYNTGAGSSTVAISLGFAVTKRAAPTVSVRQDIYDGTETDATPAETHKSGFFILDTIPAAQYLDLDDWQADAEL